MHTFFHRLWHEQDGALSFEWCLLAVLLVFGIVSGLSATRDGILDELSDVADAVLRFDQSFSIAGFGCIEESSYVDDLGDAIDCDRNSLAGQPPVDDIDS